VPVVSANETVEFCAAAFTAGLSAVVACGAALLVKFPGSSFTVDGDMILALMIVAPQAGTTSPLCASPPTTMERLKTGGAK